MSLHRWASWWQAWEPARPLASLVTRLRDVTSGATTLPVAVGRFEAGMRTRGSEVLTQAMRTVRWILATDTALGAAAPP